MLSSFVTSDWQPYLFLATFALVLAASFAPAPTRWWWRGRFFDATRHLPFSHPLQACVALVAAPLLWLLPPGAGGPVDPAAGAVLVSGIVAFFAVDYLRTNRLACDVIFGPNLGPCPVCASRVRQVARDARIAAAAQTPPAAAGDP